MVWSGERKMVSKVRVETTIDRELKKKLNEEGISYADAIQAGGMILLGEETALEVLEGRIDSLEDKIHMMIESMKEIMEKL